MEDGTGVICQGSGRKGVWYAFRDDGSTQWPERTTPGTPIPVSCIPGGRDRSTRAIHTYGTQVGGSTVYQWGAGVGLDLAYDGTTYGVYDAGSYDGITFMARSDTPGVAVQVRIGTAKTTIGDYGGVCPKEPCNPLQKTIHFGPEWQRYWVPFDALDGEGFERDKLTNLQFMVGNAAESPLADALFDFWIDDVSFYAGRPGCCAACRSTVRFGDAQLESAVRTSIHRSTGDLQCDDVCAITSLYVRNASPGAAQPLSGIECLDGLTALSIDLYTLGDLKPFASLPRLRSLDLASAGVQALTPASALQNLGRLIVSYNPLTDLSPLSGAPHLAVLDAGSSKLTSINISGWPELLYLNVSRSELTGAAVSGLPKLRDLELWGNRLGRMYLAGLDDLDRVDVSQNELQTLSGLQSLSTVTYLAIYKNPLADLGPLRNATNLKTLAVGTDPVRDLGPLVDNSGLGSGDAVYIDSGSVDCADQAANVKALRARGVTLSPLYSASTTPPFCP